MNTIKYPLTVGQRFGRWTVIELESTAQHVKCRCECGHVGRVRIVKLRYGLSQSCGCLKHEQLKQRGELHVKENLLEHTRWDGMMQRCKSKAPKALCYRIKNIQPCARMRTFVGFMQVMGKIVQPAHSLDRINNNFGYNCGECDDCREHQRQRNVRWVTMKEQRKNQTSNTTNTNLTSARAMLKSLRSLIK